MRDGFELVRTPGLALDACGRGLVLPPGAQMLVQDVRGEEGENYKFDPAKDIKVVRVNSQGGTLNRFRACQKILDDEKPLGNRALAWLLRAANAQVLGAEQAKASQDLRSAGHWYLSASWYLDANGELAAWGIGNDPGEGCWDDNHSFELARRVDGHFAMLCWA